MDDWDNDDDWENAEFIPEPAMKCADWEDEDKALIEEQKKEEELNEILKKVKIEKKKKVEVKSPEKIEKELDPLDRKRLERIRDEEQDFKNTKEIFNGISDVEIGSNSFEEMREIALQIATKIEPLRSQFNFKEFVIELNTHLIDSMPPEDIKDVVKHINVKVNEKIKAQKPKKKVSAKKSIKVERKDDFDTGENYNNDDDDFDFM